VSAPLRTTLALVVAVSLAGCNLGYYVRGAYEGARLLWNRQPIARVLERKDLSSDLRSKLELVLAVRNFASSKLALKVDGAYETLTQVDQSAVSWVVSAAPVDSLTPYTWWFPIVGAVPYKGYFSKAEAQREAQCLQKRGFDTYVRPVVAFSTLGFFGDPVLSNMLSLPKVVLAGVIIHELFHRTYFMPSNVTFDESAANYVGLSGAVAFFAATQGIQASSTKQAQEVLTSNLKFASFLHDEVASLEKLYLSGLSREEIINRRQKLFAKIQADYARLAPSLSGLERFDLDKQPLNNAVIVSLMVYFRDLDQFARLQELYHNDLRATIRAIIDLAKRHPEDPFFAIWQVAEQVAPLPTYYQH